MIPECRNCGADITQGNVGDSGEPDYEEVVYCPKCGAATSMSDYEEMDDDEDDYEDNPGSADEYDRDDVDEDD